MEVQKLQSFILDKLHNELPEWLSYHPITNSLRSWDGPRQVDIDNRMTIQIKDEAGVLREHFNLIVREVKDTPTIAPDKSSQVPLLSPSGISGIEENKSDDDNHDDGKKMNSSTNFTKEQDIALEMFSFSGGKDEIVDQRIEGGEVDIESDEEIVRDAE